MLHSLGEYKAKVIHSVPAYPNFTDRAPGKQNSAPVRVFLGALHGISQEP
jgi:hypothetical protein